jgi:polyphosphate glucokinase
MFDVLLHFDRLYVGGGNAKTLEVDLGHRVTIVDNSAGIVGGIKLWRSTRSERCCLHGVVRPHR